MLTKKNLQRIFAAAIYSLSLAVGGYWSEALGQLADPDTLIFNPIHDAYAKSASPEENYGSAGTLRLRNGSSGIERSYLKFELSGLSGALQSATLRLYVMSASDDGGGVYAVSNNFLDSTVAWTEDSLTWNNAPEMEGQALAEADTAHLDTWVEFEVTSAIEGDGTYSFGLKNSISDRVKYGSKDGDHPPQLVVVTQSGLPPSIVSFAPQSGTIATEVEITGMNFVDITEVAFNDVAAADFSVDSDSVIHTQVPIGATTGKIKVTNLLGTAVSEDSFTVLLPPRIDSFSPAQGHPGLEISIFGKHFSNTIRVAFNDTPAVVFTAEADTLIRAEVPVGATTGKVSVANSNGISQSRDEFVVTETPERLLFLPMDDARTKSTLPDNNFGKADALRARFGDPAFNSYLKFKVTGLTGPPLVATLRLYAMSDSPIGGSIHSVSNNYLNSDEPWDEQGITWNNAPTINDASLSSTAAIQTDTWVELDVTSAIAGNGIYSLGLTTSSGNNAIYSSKEGEQPPELLIHTVLPAPAIVSFSPDSGAAGDEVTIVGENLSFATAVSFNGSVADSFVIDSENQIRARVPEGATTGKISVTTGGGTAMSPGDFIVVEINTGVDEKDAAQALPKQIALKPAYPNPFNIRTTIEYALPKAMKARVLILNLKGQIVAELVNQQQAAGHKRIVWNGRNSYGKEISSGIYFVKLEADRQRFVRQVVLLK